MTIENCPGITRGTLICVNRIGFRFEGAAETFPPSGNTRKVGLDSS
jgi:hypothetical protein